MYVVVYVHHYNYYKINAIIIIIINDPLIFLHALNVHNLNCY